MRRRSGLLGRRHLHTSMLLLSLIVIVATLIVVFFLSYSLTRGLVRENATRSAERMLAQVERSIEDYLHGMVEVSDYLVTEATIRDYLKAPEPETKEEQVRFRLSVLSGTRSDLRNLILVRTDGRFVADRSDVEATPNRDVKETDWYQKALEASGAAVFTSSRVESFLQGEYPWVITMSRAIWEGDQLSGVLLLDLNYRAIEEIFQATKAPDAADYLFIVGADGRLVYHPQQQLIYSGIKTERLDVARAAGSGLTLTEEGDRLYLGVQSEITGWAIVSVIDMNRLVRLPLSWFSSFLLVGLTFAILAVVVSWLAARKLTKPLFQLQRAMHAFENGDLYARANVAGTSEVSDLGESFNAMTDRVRSLIDEKLEVEEQKRQSELLALQAQIRPHFLYNTLESIIWMGETGENENVVRMTSALAKLLRAQIQGGSEMLRLDEELNYVDHYLTIQKMRYRDRLNYTIELETGLEDARVPRLILQPLVENAIYHGTRQSAWPGRIDIGACRQEEDLVLEVRDNGEGFSDPANWRRASAEGGGIGLANVNDRIQLLYGPTYGVEVESTSREEGADEGKTTTVVRLRLPLVRT